MNSLRSEIRITSRLLIVIALAAVFSVAANAQQSRSLDDPHPVVPGAAAKKKPQQKPPRALAVLEWTTAADAAATAPAPVAPTASIGSDAPPSLREARAGSPAASTPAMQVPAGTQGTPAAQPANTPVAARLIPVAVYYAGQLQDGGVYLAEPAPLAVRAENVFAAEHAGDPLGYFTILESTRERSGWLGFGKWNPLEQEGGSPLGPGLHHGPSFPQKNPLVDPYANKDDDDKPTLRRHQVPVKGKRPVAPQSVTIPDPGADPDRPRLTPKASGDSGSLPELTGFPAGFKQTVAISDSATMEEERSFAHQFADAQESLSLQAQMQQLALSLLNANAPKAPAVAKTPAPVRRIPVHSTMQRSPMMFMNLTNIQFGAYDLTYQDEPTYVFAAQQPAADGKQRFVCVIARPDVYGKLQPVWSAVTDTSTLAITPRYRLVDAVDMDGDGRAEILLEARQNDGRRFVLFQLYRGAAKQIFETELLPD